MRRFTGAIGLAVVLVELHANAQLPHCVSRRWARPPVRTLITSTGETRHTIAATPDAASPRPGSWTVNTVASVTRAAWNGDRLVTATHVASKMIRPGNGPGEFNLENTFPRTFSLDASLG